MAKHYGVLPSDVINRASTFDLMVYDISLTWEQHQRDEANGGGGTQYSQEQLLEIIGKKWNGRWNKQTHTEVVNRLGK